MNTTILEDFCSFTKINGSKSTLIQETLSKTENRIHVKNVYNFMCLLDITKILLQKHMNENVSNEKL